MVGTLQPKKLKAKVPCEAMGLLWLNEDMSAFIVGVVCDSCEVCSPCHMPYNSC